MKALTAELRPAIAITLILGAVTCGAYPLLVTGIAQAAFKHQATGSLITGKDGKVVGSELLGQSFAAPACFHPRPSAAGAGYDASSSGGSNLGPTSQKLNDLITERVAAYRASNALTADIAVPADAVTASGSGLDPHISLRNAELQMARVAKARGLAVEKVRGLIQASIEPPGLGLLGGAGVNVLKLNLSLDNGSPL